MYKAFSCGVVHVPEVLEGRRDAAQEAAVFPGRHVRILELIRPPAQHGHGGGHHLRRPHSVPVYTATKQYPIKSLTVQRRFLNIS